MAERIGTVEGESEGIKKSPAGAALQHVPGEIHASSLCKGERIGCHGKAGNAGEFPQ